MRSLASFAGYPGIIGLEVSGSATIHVLPGALEFEFKAQPLLRLIVEAGLRLVIKRKVLMGFAE